MQPVGQEQCLGRQLPQQFQGQRPFGLAIPPDGGGQRILLAQFEQHAGGDFGKGGVTAPGLGFAYRGFDLGVLVRLNCVPSSATSRQPRQNASETVAARANGRKPKVADELPPE